MFEDPEEKWTKENRVRWTLALFFSEKVWKTPLGVVSLHEESKNGIQKMEQEPLYPIGEQSFENIRRKGAVYVDKTDLVYRMTHKYGMVFLSRPRRFGKTMLTRTLQCYFEGKRGLTCKKLC